LLFKGIEFIQRGESGGKNDGFAEQTARIWRDKAFLLQNSFYYSTRGVVCQDGLAKIALGF